MVRIKERYLLVNILYPSAIGTKPGVPDVVVINQPTTDKLTAQALLRAIRDEVSSLFGDYGAGSIEGGGLSGTSHCPRSWTFSFVTADALQSNTSPQRPPPSY